MVNQNEESAENKNTKTRNAMVERFNPLQEYINIKNELDAMQEIFMTGPRRTPNRTPKLTGEALANAKDLSKWELEDGSVIYARNADEAVKRAKKRGLWKPGYSIKRIEA